MYSHVHIAIRDVCSYILVHYHDDCISAVSHAHGAGWWWGSGFENAAESILLERPKDGEEML